MVAEPYLLGQPIRLSTTVRDVNDALADPGGLTLTVLKPDLTALPSYTTPTRDGLGLYHQDIPASDLTQVGAYRFKWVSTGANAGVSTGDFVVADPFLVPLWVPTLAGVAALLPTRTVNQSPADPTDPTYLGTFTSATIPTAAQVDLLISGAVAWVTGWVGTVLPAFSGLAEAAATMRTAGLVLTAYPLEEQGAPADTAQRWLDQADAALRQLVAANGAAGGTGPGETAAVVGASSFPDPPLWAEGWLA